MTIKKMWNNDRTGEFMRGRKNLLSELYTIRSIANVSINSKLGIYDSFK